MPNDYMRVVNTIIKQITALLQRSSTVLVSDTVQNNLIRLVSILTVDVNMKNILLES